MEMETCGAEQNRSNGIDRGKLMSFIVVLVTLMVRECERKRIKNYEK